MNRGSGDIQFTDKVSGVCRDFVITSSMNMPLSFFKLGSVIFSCTDFPNNKPCDLRSSVPGKFRIEWLLSGNESEPFSAVQRFPRVKRVCSDNRTGQSPAPADPTSPKIPRISPAVHVKRNILKHAPGASVLLTEKLFCNRDLTTVPCASHSFSAMFAYHHFDHHLLVVSRISHPNQPPIA